MKKNIMTSSPSMRYPVELEVAGPIAMFARPDSGGTPTSYPAPTWSAAKGLYEAIARFGDGAAWICPIKVEVCRRVGDPGGSVRFCPYTTNYGGPLRKTSLMSKGTTSGGSSFQLRATVLSDVCYRLHGVVVGPQSSGRVNARHHLKDLFDRRLKRGQSFATPRLGWSEFTCSYWGPFRYGVTEVDAELSRSIPSMLLAMWDRPTDGCYRPTFRQDAEIVQGVLSYDVPQEWLVASNLPEQSRAQ